MNPRPGDDWPDTANVAAGLAGVAAVLALIPSDAGELARARRVGGLTIAAGLPTGVLSGGGAWPSQTWTSALFRTKRMPGSSSALMERAWDEWPWPDVISASRRGKVQVASGS